MKKSRLFTVKELVLLSLFAALSIILTRFVYIMLSGGTIRLSFGSIPIIFSGIAFGPLAGGIVGVVSDLLGVLINPQGAFHPGFTLSSALTGIIPGLVVVILKKRNFIAICISNILVYIIVSLLLNTYWLSTLLGKAFLFILPNRALAGAIVAVISIIIIQILISTANRTKLLK